MNLSRLVRPLLVLASAVAVASVAVTGILGEYDTSIAIVNAVSTVVFPILLGATLGKQIGRVRWYRRQGKPVPVILKRGILLMLAFSYLYGWGLFLRLSGLNVVIIEVGLPRLLYLSMTTALMIAVFSYYTKTEYIDVEDPNKE